MPPAAVDAPQVAAESVSDVVTPALSPAMDSSVTEEESVDIDSTSGHGSDTLLHYCRGCTDSSCTVISQESSGCAHA